MTPVHVWADIDFGEWWSWILITYSFRDTFNTENDYNTPEVSSAIALKIDDTRSVCAKYYDAWKDGNPDNQGIGLVSSLTSDAERRSLAQVSSLTSR